MVKDHPDVTHSAYYGDIIISVLLLISVCHSGMFIPHVDQAGSYVEDYKHSSVNLRYSPLYGFGLGFGDYYGHVCLILFAPDHDHSISMSLNSGSEITIIEPAL